jgi:hypothetical protein
VTEPRSNRRSKALDFRRTFEEHLESSYGHRTRCARVISMLRSKDRCDLSEAILVLTACDQNALGGISGSPESAIPKCQRAACGFLLS